MSFDSYDSDIYFIPAEEIEHALQRASVWEKRNSSSDKDNLFADEVLADESLDSQVRAEIEGNWGAWNKA